MPVPRSIARNDPPSTRSINPPPTRVRKPDTFVSRRSKRAKRCDQCRAVMGVDGCPYCDRYGWRVPARGAS